MRIDLHNHTAHGSGDALIEPDELVEIARARGLDGVCITEHAKERTPLAEELARRHRFPVFGGMEASSELGDFLVFGVASIPRRIIAARDIREYVLAQGGVMVLAHPFRWDLSPKPWIGPRDPDLTLEKALGLPVLGLVEALEVVNGQSTPEDVAFTREVSRRAGLGGTGGSDAHTTMEIARCCTVFEDAVRSKDGLVRALRSGRYRAEDRRPLPQKAPIDGAADQS
jgi:predicted metal-dependent phosphoesterase TrpH